MLGVGRGQVKKLEDTNNYILRPYNHYIKYGWYKNTRTRRTISGPGFSYYKVSVSITKPQATYKNFLKLKSVIII